MKTEEYSFELRVRASKIVTSLNSTEKVAALLRVLDAVMEDDFDEAGISQDLDDAISECRKVYLLPPLPEHSKRTPSAEKYRQYLGKATKK